MEEPEPVHVLIGGNQNAGKSSIVNVLCQRFGCLPFLNSTVPKIQASRSTGSTLALRPRPDLPPSSFNTKVPQCCIASEDPHHSHTHDATKVNCNTAPSRPPLLQSPTDGILAPEGNCSHTTWLTTNYIINPVQGWDEASVSVEVVYRSAESVLHAMLAAHRVRDKADAAAAESGSDAAALAVLWQGEGLLNQGLQFSWPTNPYNTLKAYVAQKQQQQADTTEAAAAAAAGSCPAAQNTKPPIAAAPAAAAASSTSGGFSASKLIPAIRASLSLSAEQWQKLGCIEILQLPQVSIDGQCYSYGAAIHELLNRHVWVRTTGHDPNQWLGNRHLRLISHVDVNIPATATAPHVVLIDSQGREQHTGIAGPHNPPSGPLQQQFESSSSVVGWCPTFAASTAAATVNGIVYVVKENTESGVGFIQNELTAEVMDAWVQLDMFMKNGQQDRSPSESLDKVVSSVQQQPTAPCLLVLIMAEKIESEIYSKVGRYQLAKALVGSEQAAAVRSYGQELLGVVDDIVQDKAGVKLHLTSLIIQKVARMLLGAKGVPAGQETTVAARVVSRHATIHHVFPWTWAGQSITSRGILKGIEQGELLTWQQSGLQALDPLLFCKQPAPIPVSNRLLRVATEAEQQLEHLLKQQHLAIATPLAASTEQLQQLHTHIREFFLEPAIKALETQKVKLQALIPIMEAQVCSDWQARLSSCKAASNPGRTARRLLGALHSDEHVVLPLATDSSTFSDVVADFEEQNYCCAFTGHDLARLLRGQLDHPKSAAQLLFPAFLEDKLDPQACLPALFLLPQIAELSSELMQAAESTINTYSAQPVPPAHTRDPKHQRLGQQQQEPHLISVQSYLQGVVQDLSTLAVAASAQIQHAEPTTASMSCSEPRPLQQQVLQVCQTLVQDLAIRLAHTAHVYLGNVLSDRWRAGWAIHEVYFNQGVQQQLEERLADAATAVVSKGHVSAEWFEWLIFNEGPGVQHTERAGSSSDTQASLSSADNAGLLTWLCADFSKRLTETSSNALDDLQSAISWLCEDWSCSSRKKVEKALLLSGTTATTEIAWRQTVQLTFTTSALQQLAADLSLHDSIQDASRIQSPQANVGTTGSSSAADERRKRFCCPLQESLTAAETCLLLALKQQYAHCQAPASRRSCDNLQAGSTSTHMTAADPGSAGINRGCVSWLTASVSFAANRLAAELPGVADASKLLGELAKTTDLATKVCNAAAGAAIQLDANRAAAPGDTRSNANTSSSVCTSKRPHAMIADAPLAECTATAEDDVIQGIMLDLSQCLQLWKRSNPLVTDAVQDGGVSAGDTEAETLMQLTLPLCAGGSNELLLSVLKSLYAEASLGHLTTWLSQLPSTALHVPDYLPEEFDDKLQSRFINQELWRLNDMAVLIEAFVERHKVAVAGLDLRPLVWKTPDADLVAKVAEFYNKYMLCVSPDVPPALSRQENMVQKVQPGAVVVQVIRDEEAGTARCPTIEYFRRSGVVWGLSGSSSSMRDSATPATASTAVTENSPVVASTSTMHRGVTHDHCQHQHGSLLLNSPSSGDESGGKAKWRVLWDTLKRGSDSERDVDDLDEDEVLQLLLPIQSHRDFSLGQLTRAEDHSITVAADATEVFFGDDEQYSLAVSSTGESKQHLVGSCGRLRSREEIKVALMRLHAELQEEEPGSDTLAPILNRYFGPLKGLSKDWTWFQMPHQRNSGQSLSRWRLIMGGSSTQTFLSKASALLFQAGLEHSKGIGHYQDTGPEEVRRNPENWLWSRSACNHAYYSFIALDQLQCPGLQRLVTSWREIQRHVHQRREIDDDSLQPALCLRTRVSFAKFVLEGMVDTCQGTELFAWRPKTSPLQQDSKTLPYTAVQPMTADDVSSEIEKGLRISRTKRGP